MTIDATFAFERYQAVRPRLPVATFPKSAQAIDNLLQIADQFDAFIFDAFGVLNVGESPIPGAAQCVRRLQEIGKKTLVLTNAGSFALTNLRQKYQKLGFTLTLEQIVSSREQLFMALAHYPTSMHWGVAALPESGIDQLDFNLSLLGEETTLFDQVDGFLFLGARDWTKNQQQLLVDSLRRCPRPLLVGNPDIVAPRESGFSFEPGYYAHGVADQTSIEPIFYGKPFADVFYEVYQRLASVRRSRVLMLGDTLHTDILGGSAVGFKTALVTHHGLFKGLNAYQFIEQCGIVPDFILPTI